MNTVKEYINAAGLLHREDGPAIEYPNGSKAWYVNGKIHRLDGPAVEEISGTKCWYINGLCHRTDGPANMWPNGDVEYWITGKYYNTYLEYLVAVEQYKQNQLTTC